MSWSVSAVGNASRVAAKLATDFANSKCSEPEETIKNTVASAVATALTAFPPNYAVRVEASGSQSVIDVGKAPHQKTNQLVVKIEPLWGFLQS
jgi:hypothetical protein